MTRLEASVLCGRFTLNSPFDLVARFFDLVAMPSLTPRYNIAPTQDCLVVRRDAASGERRADLLHWGLIPSWAKDKAIGSRMINARSETAAEKPSFRTALKKRRCVIPADGFYEWQKREKTKQPFLIHRADGELLAFAGLWEYWKNPEGEPITSFTILTTAANDQIRELHDRMPVILEPEEIDQWLDPAIEDEAGVADLLDPAADGILAIHPVSTRVNTPKNDDASLVEPDRNLFE